MSRRAGLLLVALMVTVVPPGVALGQEGEPTGTITGTVQGEFLAATRPLEGVCVTARPVEGFSWSAAATATSDVDGSYTLEGLAVGRYAVGFNTCDEPAAGWAFEWWDDAPALGDAQFVRVEADTTHDGVDAVLAEAGTLRGTVTAESSGDSLAGVCVQVMEIESFATALTETGEDGSYVLPNLPGGDYQVGFVDCTQPLTLISEAYDDVSLFGYDTSSPPEEITVTAGEETGGIDAALTEGAMIQGTVTAEHTGEPVSFTCVALHDPAVDGEVASLLTLTYSGFGPSWLTDRDTATVLDGAYFFGGVPTGDYQVGVNPTLCGDDAYGTWWSGGADSRPDAASLTLTPGEVADGVDASIAPTPDISFMCPASAGVVVEDGPDGTTRSRPAPSRFDDVEDDDAHGRAIDCLARIGAVEGDGDGHYRPHRRLRRGQLASVTARVLELLGTDLPDNPADAFTDDDGTVHEAAINQLAALELVAGTAEDRFDPGHPVRRDQLTKILVGAYEHVTGFTLRATDDHFSDDDGTALESFIDRAATAALTAGTADGGFSPDATVPRGQAATFLARLLNRVVRDTFDIELLLTLHTDTTSRTSRRARFGLHRHAG